MIGIGLFVIMLSPLWFISSVGKRPYVTLATLGMTLLVTALLAVWERHRYNNNHRRRV